MSFSSATCLLSERQCEAEVLADEESKLIPCDCTSPCKYVLFMKLA